MYRRANGANPFREDGCGCRSHSSSTGRTPSRKRIAEQNEAMIDLQARFRIAADCVAGELAQLPHVRRVVLIGSVASPLKMEVPRFSEFRNAGIPVWHECMDVDLAVWVSDPTNLRSLQQARSTALKQLLADHNIGVAHHQVEIFVMEPGTDQYLGRLCTFSSCPKNKSECRVPGCGAFRFLQQHADFRFDVQALSPERCICLYDAETPG